ncbi:MAG: hypothetical protein RLP15_08395 [Cryomorphaceae bacterium]
MKNEQLTNGEPKEELSLKELLEMKEELVKKLDEIKQKCPSINTFDIEYEIFQLIEEIENMEIN